MPSLDGLKVGDLVVTEKMDGERTRPFTQAGAMREARMAAIILLVTG
ncbi:hypothetical protein [Agrobacterium cavarae]|nr:hypothetical protein [Agrobacterium cavarae]